MEETEKYGERCRKTNTHRETERERGEKERGGRKMQGLQVHGATTLNTENFLNIAFSLYHKFVNVNLVTIVQL